MSIDSITAAMEMQHDIAAMPVAVHPDRPRLRKRPLKAIHHFRELLKDKENTEHVFHIFESLPRKAFRDEARAFAQSERGRAIYASEPYLPDVLDDHERLRAMPAGSVAHAYCNFMETEGLTAAGLVEESAKLYRKRYGDLVEWYGSRNRDTHDLLHVLTGYGRDALGEACLLGFSFSQNYNKGILFIAYAGARQIKKVTGTRAPLFSAVREGQRLGKAAAKLAHMDVEAVMREDINAARMRLGIGKPVIYRQCLATLQEEGYAQEMLGLSVPQAA